jgi:hypothetical protein
MKIPLLILIFAVLSCVFLHKPCDKVTDDDIIGVYVSCNSANNNKQYIEIFKGGKFYMVYCDGKTTIKEWGTWKRYNGCRVFLGGIRWFNTGEIRDTVRSGGGFGWVGGKLAMGEDDWSFQKVRRKPELICEL